jgi:putative Holliday junction resolvase
MTLPSGRRLAIDYGQVRSGIALSDINGLIATPLETILSSTLLDRLLEIASEYEISTIYLGLPAHLSGAEGESARLVRAMARKIADIKVAPVYLVDERLSTKSAIHAKELVERFGVDAVAAAEILELSLSGERNTGKRFGEAMNE